MTKPWQDILGSQDFADWMIGEYGAVAMLKAWAALHGMSQGQVAIAIGMHQGHLSRQMKAGRLGAASRKRLGEMSGVWLGEPVEDSE